ncbi:unnamed protein product [Heligmosomoides polygyrus]|uniref:G_PROTEIN_RECEP_F1_2 domain-containing protein n=1 Tax=Heligmosomoides polygyrus TaxID=6339 RepID=A0A183FNQ8_HELPZ|nr:unnamed protein product [Heligmosomoides polygyrus]
MEKCTVYTDTVKDPSLETPVIIGFSVLYRLCNNVCVALLSSNPLIAIKLVEILYLYFSIEFVLGITGNIGVIFFTFGNRKLQTVQNMFILNLALADLIVCIFSLPLTPITSIYKNWYFGDQMCHSLPWIQVGIFHFLSCPVIGLFPRHSFAI